MENEKITSLIAAFSLTMSVLSTAATAVAPSDSDATVVTEFNASDSGCSYTYLVCSDDENRDKYFAIYDESGILKKVTKNKTKESFSGDYTGCSFKLFVWEDMKPMGNAITEVTPVMPDSGLHSFDFTTASVDEMNNVWEIKNEDKGSYTLDSNGLTINTQRGDIAGAATNYKNLFFQDADGDWTVETEVRFGKMPYQQYQQASLIAMHDEDNYIKMGYESGYGQYAQLGIENNGSLSSQGQNWFPAEHIYFRLEKKGGKYTGSYSTNGTDWTAAGSAEMDWDNVKVGLLATNGDQDAESIPVTFKYLKVLQHVITETPKPTGKPTTKPTDDTSGQLINMNFDNSDLSSSASFGKAAGTPIFTEEDGRKCIKFDGTRNTVVDLLAADGGSLLTGIKEMTIEFKVKPTSANTSWWFYASSSDGAPLYLYEYYLGAMTKDSELTVERYANNGSRPPAVKCAYNVNEWNDIKIIVEKSKTTVVVNGNVQSENSTVDVASLLGNNSVAHIGLANWEGGEYATGYMDDFVIYDHAVEIGDVTPAPTHEPTPKPTKVPSDSKGRLISMNFDNGDLSSDAECGKAEGHPKFEEVDGRKCIRFDGTRDTVVNLFNADGGSLLTEQDEITISFDIKPTTEGTSWWFYAAPNAERQWYPSEHYLGALTNGSTLTVQRWNNYGSRPPVNEAQYKVNEWNNVNIFVKKDETTVYVNGVNTGTVSSGVNIAEMLGGESVAYIGLANWDGGEFATGYMDNFVIYDHVVDINLELGDLSEVTDNIELPTALEDGTHLEWTSSNEDVISSTGAVTRYENTQEVTLTAAATIDGIRLTKAFKAFILGYTAAIDEFTAYSSKDGKLLYTGKYNLQEPYTMTVKAENVETNELIGTADTISGEFNNVELSGRYKVTAQISKDGTVIKEASKTVKIKEEQEMGAYLFAHFVMQEWLPEHEQIYFSVSTDGVNWKTINRGAPLLTSNVGEKGVRDPYILRGEDGKFFIIATDLSINRRGGNWVPSVWDDCQKVGNGSTGLVIWESDDLVNWSEARLVDVAPEDAGNAWAPEAIYDSEKDSYMVFWASRTTIGDTNENRIYRSYTKDFKTFTEPEIYIDGGNASNIDTSIIEVKGIYYRFTKDYAPNAVTLMKSRSLDEGWEDVDTYTIDGVNGKDLHEYEGPAIYKLNGEEKWCLLLDHFTIGAGYQPFITDDLSKAEFVSAGACNYDSTYRHGTVMPITDDEYNALINAYPTN